MSDRQQTGVFETDVLVTLERLETHIEGLVGNGQPGKIKLLENVQDEHSARLDRLWGGLILTGFLLGTSIVGEIIVHLFKAAK